MGESAKIRIDLILGPVLPVGSRQLDKADWVWLDVHSWPVSNHFHSAESVFFASLDSFH